MSAGNVLERAQQHGSASSGADTSAPAQAPGKQVRSGEADSGAQASMAAAPAVQRREASAASGVADWAMTPGLSSALGLGVAEKSVNGGGQVIDGVIIEGGVDGALDGGGKAEEAQAPPPKKKKAGVESFTVDWAVGASNGPTAAKLRLDYNAKFKKDDDHDPALAEFRQNVMTKLEVTAGPNKGMKADTSPMHDDNYSRADDTAGNKKTDQLFVSNDNPGASPIDKDDVIDYSFTAEQMIIDTSDGNKVIAKRGPHTGTIKGKDPRASGGVPKKLS